MKAVENRRASRIILLDGRGRVLLFRYAHWKGGRFWATPGGGLEEGETFEEAVRREASEELGITATRIRFLWESTVDILYMDRQVHQWERHFQLEGERPSSLADVRREHEQEGILETRWWTTAELESTSELVFPKELPLRLIEIPK